MTYHLATKIQCLPITIVGYFLFQTINSITEKPYEYFIFFQKAAANPPADLERERAQPFPRWEKRTIATPSHGRAERRL